MEHVTTATTFQPAVHPKLKATDAADRSSCLGTWDGWERTEHITSQQIYDNTHKSVGWDALVKTKDRDYPVYNIVAKTLHFRCTH